jgi:hypothetical protein
MGLLEKINAMGGPEGFVLKSAEHGVKVIVSNFCMANPSFHCIVLMRMGRGGVLSGKVTGMASCHGAVCKDLPDGDCLVLLPGGLDAELFSHRIARSTGSAVAFQLSADSPSPALDALHSYFA